MAPIAFDLGAKWAPLTVDEAESYLLRLRPKLYAGPQARQARDWLFRGVADDPGERAVYSLVVAAAVGVLPDGPAASWASPWLPRSTSWSTRSPSRR